MKKFLFICMFLLNYPALVLAQPVEVKPPQNKVLASPNGRYVFGQISDFRADQFLLDTKTGRLWQIVVDKKTIKNYSQCLLSKYGAMNFTYQILKKI